MFALMFLSVGQKAQSQVELEINGGYGFYNLNDLKSMQTDALSAIGLPNIKSTETFPNHFFYSFAANCATGHKSSAGLRFSYHTTGGRNHLADYSGEYKLDMILNGYKIGAEYRHLFLSKGKLEAGLQCNGGIIISRLQVNEKFKIADQNITSAGSEMKNTGFFVEPAIRVSYGLFRNLELSFNGGYEFDFTDKLRLDDEKTNVSADWSGIRASLGIAYGINFKKDN